jgi:hypothetical protein
MANQVVLFFKAVRRDAAGTGDMLAPLVQMPVQVSAYTRKDGAQIPAHTELRKVRGGQKDNTHNALMGELREMRDREQEEDTNNALMGELSKMRDRESAQIKPPTTPAEDKEKILMEARKDARGWRNEIDEVNRAWRILSVEIGHWFNGDGKSRKLRANAPEEVVSRYDEYKKWKSRAKKEYDVAMKAVEDAGGWGPQAR